MTIANDGWIRSLTHPLRTLDPDDTDYSDLEPLRAIVGKARVVSIGESTHHAREFYLLRHRLARFLIRELGFTAFVMESGFPEGVGVNEWVHGAAGDLESVARAGITWGFGGPEEVHAQVKWLREWNASQAREKKVSFYGMDVPGSGVSAKPAIETCLRRLGSRPGDEALLALADLGVRMKEALARYEAMTPADRERLSAGIADLVERATAAGDEVAYRCAVGARVVDELIKGGLMPRPDWNPRDALMAQNVRWVLDRHERIVIGAHNGHIQRGTFMSAPMMGQYLAPVLGKDMLVIGSTYASGRAVRVHMDIDPDTGRLNAERLAKARFSYDELAPPPAQTTDALMDCAGLPLHMLDLRKVPAERLATVNSMRVFHDPLPIDPREAFDVLIHVRHVSPVAGEPGPAF